MEEKKLIQKAMKRGIFYGLGIAFLLGLLVVGLGIFAYLNGFFDDNGGKLGLEIDRNVDTSNEREISIEVATPSEPEPIIPNVEPNQETPEITNVNSEDTYVSEQVSKVFSTIDSGKNEDIAANNGEREHENVLLELEENKQTEVIPSVAESKPVVVEPAKETPEPSQKVPLASAKLNAHDIDFVNLYESINDEKAKDFFTTYYLLYKHSFSLVDFETKWKAYDLPNKPQIDFNAIKDKRPALISKDMEGEFLKKKQEYVTNMQNSKMNATKTGVIINPCFYTFCSENKEVYGYVKQAMIHDQELINQLLVAKKDGISPKFYLTILLIENVRMHTQYKGAFKSVFMKYSSPKLAVMSKFSYGKYGTKVNFITQLMNNNYRDGSVFSIGDYPVLKELKDNYYWQHQTTKQWHPKSEGTVVDWLIKNKQAQTDIISAFFKMAQKGWITKGVDLWKAENAGILLTLYNIGKLGEPKPNPELGGSTLSFVHQKYNFGELANIIYNSLELDDIMQQMKL